MSGRNINNNPFEKDVESGSNTNSAADQFTIGDVDDESTLRPPPSEGMTDFGSGGVYDEDGHLESLNINHFDDDYQAPVHDQLPTPEEYKARMSGEGSYSAAFAQFSPSKLAAEASEAGSVIDENIHDQLPTVDEYKSSGTFRSNSNSRAGLYTFLLLFLITAIITAITVPLVLKDEEPSTSSSTTHSGGSSTRPPTTVRPPSTEAEKTRYEKVIDYLVDAGVSTRSALQDDTDSPQYKAATWISNVDEYQIPLPSDLASDTPEEVIPHTRFTERYALAVFYYSTEGDSWKYGMGFMEPVDHCEWFQDFIATSGEILRLGVSECKTLGEGFEDKLVHKLEMPNNGLIGNLPTEMQFLHRLTKLALPFNAKLTTQSSMEGLHMLTYLTDLELQYCAFQGVIPEWIGNLGSLTNLGLGNNLLEGGLPDSFFKLTKLVVLGLDDNELTGSIAPFTALSNLESLYLEDNFFSGELTVSLFTAWSKMVELDLSFNELDGPLPSNMWSTAPNLEVIDIHGNSFLGPIPEIDVAHDNLFFLALHDNELDWRIPETINNLVNLAHLDVSKNKLVLPFPSTMSQLTSLRYLFTGNNIFENHSIPEWLKGMTNLHELSMKRNSLTGQIPTFLGSLTRLQVLDLDGNSLESSIPEELGRLTSLDTLMLNRNKLSGPIPESFALLHDLDVLLLNGNEIDGTADLICNDDSINLTHFVADCAGPNPEIVCKCCDLCCKDSNTTCNNFDWHINLDPIWEYGFRRVVYSFSQEVLPPP